MDTQAFSKIVNTGKTPSRADIAELLSEIGAPGEKRDEKVKAVRDLYDELGGRGTNSQGIHVADDLSNWVEY